MTIDILQLTFDKKKSVKCQVSSVKCRNGVSLVELLSDDVLVLQIWPLNASGDPSEPNPSPTPQYDYIVYKKVSDTLKKNIVPAAGSTRQASDKIIASKISALSFTYDNADASQAAQVTINLTTQNTVNNVTQTDTQTSTAVIRNK